jgi:antirestriction protein ArdC
MAKTRKDWSAEISARFIAELQNGRIPWIKPWDDWASWSRDSGKDYNGINQLMLSGGEFATFKQIKEAGGSVNKGAKGEKVVFYKEYFKKIEVEDEDGETEEAQKKIKMLKCYTVFRITDTDLEVKHEKKQPVHRWKPENKAEKLVKEYAKAHGIKITHGGNRAFNSTLDNSVTLPNKEQFKDRAEYYSTVFHELTHSTARFVGRDLSQYAKDKKARAREELVAEIGAAYIMSYLGIEQEMQFKNSAGYIQGWASNLKDDKNAILYATPKAIEAANMILNIQ